MSADKKISPRLDLIEVASKAIKALTASEQEVCTALSVVSHQES